jgi:hypothetical protein
MWNLLAQVLGLVIQLSALKSKLWVFSLFLKNFSVDHLFISADLRFVLSNIFGCPNNRAIRFWDDASLRLVDDPLEIEAALISYRKVTLIDTLSLHKSDLSSRQGGFHLRDFVLFLVLSTNLARDHFGHLECK